MSDKREILKFGTGASVKCQRGGWSSPEDGFTWSKGGYAETYLPFDSWPSSGALVIKGRPFVVLDLPVQRLRFWLDGKFVGEVYSSSDAVYFLPLKSSRGARGQPILRIEFPDARAPSEVGASSDTRRLAFAWKSIELVDSSEPSLQDLRSDFKWMRWSSLDSTSKTLLRWCINATSYWAIKPMDRDVVRRSVEILNETMYWAAMFVFEKGQVTLIPKPKSHVVSSVILARAHSYLKLFQLAADRMSPAFSATICVCVADLIKNGPGVPSFDYGIPVFAYQRAYGENTILIPDMEFVEYGYYLDEQFQDTSGFEDKADKAGFAGATTGGDIDLITAENLVLPRLEAAGFFLKVKDVDFRLPRVVQCTCIEAEQRLLSFEFCQQPTQSWKEQFRNKLLISMDGNGATCSRVVLSLASNSALVKYESRYELFYTAALRPGRNFIAVKMHGEIEELVRELRQDSSRFKSIAFEGREFAKTYLCQERIVEYTSYVLQRYAAKCLSD